MRVSAPLRINGSFSAAERKSPSAECGMRAPPFDCQQRTAQGHAATMTYLFISVNKSTITTNIPTGTGRVSFHIISSKIGRGRIY